jgi:hypothetical protein
MTKVADFLNSRNINGLRIICIYLLGKGISSDSCSIPVFEGAKSILEPSGRLAEKSEEVRFRDKFRDANPLPRIKVRSKSAC